MVGNIFNKGLLECSEVCAEFKEINDGLEERINILSRLEKLNQSLKDREVFRSWSGGCGCRLSHSDCSDWQDWPSSHHPR